VTLAAEPISRLAAEALTDTPATVAVAVAVVTVMLTVPLCPPNVPVIVVVPPATAVTVPVLSTGPAVEIVATPGALDSHVGVMTALFPSL
jgi:hypothetical protein